MARTLKTFSADQEGEALATALHRLLEVSHRQAKGLIDASCVKVNGGDPSGYGQRLKTGDQVEVAFDAATEYKALPKPTKSARAPFEVLWEDKHLLFVNKPAGLLTVPTETGNDPNLADAITDSFRRRGFKRFNLYIVHRLDRWTSGVLVFAKTPEALHGLKKLFEAHDLNRVYKAVVVGEIQENSGSLHGKLVEHSKSLRIHVDRSGKTKGAKAATTHYRVLERLPGHTVVEVKLETGRRNQIRVQFSDKGFPLLGDHVYGEESPLIERQALHAELLGFRHPVTEDVVTVMAPLPEDMEAALRTLRTRARVQRAEAGEKGDASVFKPKITLDRKMDRVRRARRFGEAPEPPSARPGGRPSKGPRPAGARAEGPGKPARAGEKGREPRSGRPPRQEGGRPPREGAEAGARGPAKGPGKGPGRPAAPRREGQGPARGPARSARPSTPSGERPRTPFAKGAKPPKPRKG